MLNRILSRIRTPVQREMAETFLLLTLLSFAGSVSATRLFLELTGYPQLGGGGLHVAHVLWGGLLLFGAALIPVIFANQWALFLDAVLAGLGVGLFIDEVGKFITQSNDYFYPGAAPIIYAFFLLIVLLYARLARKRAISDARTELYYVLGALQEVLDRDLEPGERIRLQSRLVRVTENAHDPNLARLAEVLHEFIRSSELELAPERPDPLEGLASRFKTWESTWATHDRLKAVIIGGLSGLAIIAIRQFAQLLLVLFSPARLETMVTRMVLAGSVNNLTGLAWFSVRLGMEGAVGLFLLSGAVLILLNREARGLTVAYIGLLVSLAGVNLLVFYFEQFSTILIAAIEFSALLIVLYYRRRFFPLVDDLSNRKPARSVINGADHERRPEA
jgi:hypothetical protein